MKKYFAKLLIVNTTEENKTYNSTFVETAYYYKGEYRTDAEFLGKPIKECISNYVANTSLARYDKLINHINKTLNSDILCYDGNSRFYTNLADLGDNAAYDDFYLVFVDEKKNTIELTCSNPKISTEDYEKYRKIFTCKDTNNSIMIGRVICEILSDYLKSESCKQVFVEKLDEYFNNQKKNDI